MLSMIPDSPIDYVSGQKPNTEVETRYSFELLNSIEQCVLLLYYSSMS